MAGSAVGAPTNLTECCRWPTARSAIDSSEMQHGVVPFRDGTSQPAAVLCWLRPQETTATYFGMSSARLLQYGSQSRYRCECAISTFPRRCPDK